MNCCRFSRFNRTFEIEYIDWRFNIVKTICLKGFRNIYNDVSLSDIAFIVEKGELTAVLYYRFAESAWNRFVAPW